MHIYFKIKKTYETPLDNYVKDQLYRSLIIKTNVLRNSLK